MIAAVGDLLVRAGVAPAPLDVSIDPSAPLEYAALHPAVRGPAGRPDDVDVRVVTAAELAAYAEGIRAVYADAFGGPRGTEGAGAGRCVPGAAGSDADRPGIPGAVALDEGAVLGFRHRLDDPDPFPHQPLLPAGGRRPGSRAHHGVAVRRAGGRRTRRARRGAGQGLGAALLTALTAESADGRSLAAHLRTCRNEPSASTGGSAGARPPTPHPAGRGWPSSSVPAIPPKCPPPFPTDSPEPPLRTADIRTRFLDYFAARGHTVVPSAPLPTPDPTLLFVNAGMVPFKPYLTGEATPPWPRATSVQKCVRTLDIEEVGRTTRHGSFFQMNGNFSFGDYFKEEASPSPGSCPPTPVAGGGYGLDPEKIWVTVHHTDAEAREIWRRVAGLPDERIVDRAATRTTSGRWGCPDPAALLGAVLRPGSGAAARGRPGGRRGPVHGVLEPRLHAVRTR